MTVLLLSRIQFALTISFHIIFPAFSIGLVSYLVVIEGLWLKTHKKVYYRTARYLSKILALTFGMGIISGLAMAFQMGTNWAGFSKLVGPVLGVLFTLESLTAFFVEAVFLGVMLLGWHLVSKKMHFLSTLMVCVGVTLSTFWIMSANSWMHTPAGAQFINGQFSVLSWREVILNPSMLTRFSHMLLASYIATLMVILMISAVNLLKNRFQTFALTNIKLSLLILVVLAPLQIAVGDLVGLKVMHYQPVKTAAIEGLWQTRTGAPLVLLANIDSKKRQNTFVLEIPKLASLINTHHLNGTLSGLEKTPDDELPRVGVVFYSFRVMVAMGLLIVAVTLTGLYLLKKQTLLTARWYQRALVVAAPSGFIALLTGWFTSEVGRQPWVVYGLVKTKAVVSAVAMSQVLNGLIVIFITYGLIFGVGYTSVLLRLIQKGPAINFKKKRRLYSKKRSYHG